MLAGTVLPAPLLLDHRFYHVLGLLLAGMGKQMKINVCSAEPNRFATLNGNMQLMCVPELRHFELLPLTPKTRDVSIPCTVIGLSPVRRELMENELS